LWGDSLLRKLRNFDLAVVLESKLLVLLAELVPEDENNAVEGKLNRISLTGAELCCEELLSLVLLADTGMDNVCLSVKLRPPVPVENLQRPPHGLINM
jgi:hypothetical protein